MKDFASAKLLRWNAQVVMFGTVRGGVTPVDGCVLLCSDVVSGGGGACWLLDVWMRTS